MKLSARIFVYSTFALGVILLMIIHFSTALLLVLGASIFIFFYFSKMEKDFFHTALTPPQAPNRFFLKPTFLPLVLGIISLVFLINPSISKTRGTLGDAVSGLFKVQNVDVRPSLSATLGISKAVLSQGSLLGSGPNTFGRDWLIYKPSGVNATPFWAKVFPFGVGFIPTQIASIGLLGSFLWVVFFILLALLGVRALSHLPDSRDERFALVATFLVMVLLWLSSFLYTPSETMLMLAFIFTGLFVAAGIKTNIVPIRLIDLRSSPQTRFVSIFFVIAIAAGTFYLGWIGFGKTVSAFYFQKAVNLSNTPGATLAEIESRLDQAVKFAPVDTQYVALSRVNLAEAQVAANATTGTPAENQKMFEEALRKSIESAKSAVSLNPAGFENWVALGTIYSALVPAPLSVAGAYENASFAYSEAGKRNPLGPEIPLFLAKLELNRGDQNAARSFIRKALALKEDYADAYLMLAQLEIRAGHTAEAILSTEQLVRLVPGNSGFYFELGLLKYANQDYAGALEAFRSALLYTPDYANAQYYLGLTLVKLSRPAEARALFEALAASYPDSAEVKAALKELNR